MRKGEVNSHDVLRENAQQASELLKSMANKKRLLILCSLLESELSVGEINRKVALSQSALSQHLSSLRESGVVATRKQSQSIYYRLCDERVESILSCLRAIYCPAKK